MVEITIAGTDQLIARLGRVEGANILRDPMRRAVLRLEAAMKEYPPERPGQRYVRGRGMPDADGIVRRLTSEQLGKKWTTRIKQEGEYLVGSVGNNASYGPFVQSRRFQARVHQGRWRTDEQAMNENAAAIIGDFEAAIRRALGG